MVKAGETGGGGTGPPWPHKFYLLGGTEGDPIFLKMGPFDVTLCCFSGSLLFLHTLCGPFWRLEAGALFRNGPQDQVPPPRNSFIQACLWFSLLPSSCNYRYRKTSKRDRETDRETERQRERTVAALPSSCPSSPVSHASGSTTE